MDRAEIMATAERVAEEVLFPAAIRTDASALVPLENLDALAAAGLYGVVGPPEAGGLGADFGTLCDVVEILAGACLATAFVWVQHHSAVRAVAATETPALAERFLEPLCHGRLRAGVTLGGLLPGPPRLRARPAAGGWLFDGSSPWVSGIGRIDVLQVAARDEAGTVVSALVDARAGESLEIERPRELVAVTASANAPVHFRGHRVPAERVTSLQSYAERMAHDRDVIRMHASLALGVAARCAGLAGDGPISGQVEALRARLDAATAETMPAARAAASDLALRAAAYLVTASGSRSIGRDEHPQRLAREALFLLVFGSRPAVRDALLRTLARENVTDR